MSLKDYLENDYTFEELLMLDDWFNDRQEHCPPCQSIVNKSLTQHDTNIDEIKLTVKTLIIERLKYALRSIQQSADIL